MLLKIKSILPIVFFILLCSVEIKAQMPSIRQIFDFDVNDEFHTHYSQNNGPPQASRSTIIGKYYSQYSDTLYYIIKHNDYSSTFNPSPNPHLDYVFMNYTDTVAYTDLDSSILYHIQNNPYFSTYSQTYHVDTHYVYCQNNMSMINSTTGGFEPNIINVHFALGLGSVYQDWYFSSSVPLVDDQARMIYYRKANKTCGTADTVGLAIESPMPISSISISPNPAFDIVRVHMPDDKPYQLNIYDINSKIVFSKEIAKQDFAIDVSRYSKGVYILYFYSNLNSFTSRLIVE